VDPGPKKALNAPKSYDPADRPNIAEFFAYQNDQAMIADMAIADIHFVPHSSALSGTGVARLERYAELLAADGGEVRYTTASRDEVLIGARLITAKEFLAQVIPSNQCVEVVFGLPGGRGMTVREALTGREVAEQAEKRDTAYDLQRDD
jgi:hypothetical protein